jgi:hypothetical protein
MTGNPGREAEAPLKVRRDDGPYGRYAHIPRCNSGCSGAEHWLYTGERYLSRGEAIGRALADVAEGRDLEGELP